MDHFNDLELSSSYNFHFMAVWALYNGVYVVCEGSKEPRWKPYVILPVEISLKMNHIQDWANSGT